MNTCVRNDLFLDDSGVSFLIVGAKEEDFE